MTAYDRCWAKEVSECGEGISKEHYFTRGMLPSTRVTALGTSPLPDSQRDTHIDQLVAKVLCKKHNSELSPLDDALIDLMNCIREVDRLRLLRARIERTSWPPVRLVVDGLGVERCVLKMLMNHAVVQRTALDGWAPPRWVPEVVFGVKALEPRCGLGFIARVGDVVTNAEEIGFAFAKSELTGERHSVLLEIRGGWRLICTWDKPLDSLGELQISGTSYSAGEDVLIHPRRIGFTNGDRDLGVSLDFDWSGRWTAKKHPNVASLRGKNPLPPR